MSEIAEAITTLYSVFSRYARPLTIECCPCGCTIPDATTHLVTVPLRQLSLKQLADFSSSAMTTQGTKDDFRHFLPRLLEAIFEEPYDYNLEVLFGKLDYGNWLNWPEEEIAAIRNYMHHLWSLGLRSFPLERAIPAVFEIETLLGSIARTRESLDSYLHVWTEARTRESDAHLIQFVTTFGADFEGGRTLSSAWWEDRFAQAQALRHWLLRPGTLQRVEETRYLLKEDGFEHLFEPALKILRAEGARQ